MASALVLASIWAAICTRDPAHPGCDLRPGQCYEPIPEQLICRPPEFPDLSDEDGKTSKK